MTVLLVAHGTRNPHGVEMSYRLADAIADRCGRAAAVSFVDVVGPSPSEMLAELPPGPVTVLPAFLARGHHVRVDVTRHVTQADRPVFLADALGPSRLLAQALMIRLAEAGTTCNDAVVLAAAGSSDPAAHRDIECAARYLSALRGSPVEVAFASVSGASPYRSVAETVADLRRHDRRRRVAVASYLLADGLFQRRLEESGADVVARPLGLATPVIELACARVATAREFAATECRQRAGIPV
ncbi:sirohydrochlorin chelatase [Gordonia sp. (in: high G+C Gram-positive bacteria)]|uniref:sirohydrochlorin chelatase n=1 Tax=Gordonia sp. (in: high G+C Gram-positive bacteria) TaxID=84139 RepID=UPI0016942F1B|nr:CbiX/SirB N-terminal domain-containing protein [Gordonia sp. (in: high G+C Gram-positive bacteria)]NLG45828.1 sirohydrochlorin chelatase [Gordonia sp. (in: high G+C Gram-positive bacteria)]